MQYIFVEWSTPHSASQMKMWFSSDERDVLQGDLERTCHLCKRNEDVKRRYAVQLPRNLKKSSGKN